MTSDILFTEDDFLRANWKKTSLSLKLHMDFGKLSIYLLEFTFSCAKKV